MTQIHQIYHNDLEIISLLFDIETYKLKLLLYENSLKTKILLVISIPIF